MGGRIPNEGSFDPGIRLVLEDLRDLRAEMRVDRQRADDERRQADEERRRADDERRQERRRSDERFETVMRKSDERFETVMRETDRAFNDVRSVGLSTVNTLNHHTRILERIEPRLGSSGRWHLGRGNGRGGRAER